MARGDIPGPRRAPSTSSHRGAPRAALSGPLDPQRWQKLTELFDRLVGLAAEERSVRLVELCGGDETLRAQAEALLHEADVEGVLDDPAAEVLASWLEGIEAPAREEVLGQRVGPYRLVEELGRGGMGVVYLAERADGQFEQQVALKLVMRGLDTDEVLRRFRRERQILARLDHPAIARLFDGGATEDGRPFFAMERVRGEPITVYCDSRRLPIEQRLRLFQKVFEAVEHAHGHLVVHRDLKPSNILVTAEGNLKLLDFGVAKLLGKGGGEQSTPTLTRAGHWAMTPEYAAPEQLLGDPVSPATDVYALGVVLYELVTGRRPHWFGGRFDARAERMVLEVEAPRPSALVEAPPQGQERTAEELAELRGLSPGGLRRRLAGDLDAIVLTALRKEPARRYASAQALADDIGRHLASETVTARPEGWTYRATKLAWRRRASLMVAVALVLCLGAIGLVIERGRRAARREVVKQYVATGMGLAAHGDALGALPWLTRALESEPDAQAREDHRLRIGTLLEYAPRLVRQWANEGPVVAAHFSPDGTRIVTASKDGRVRVWSVTSGEPLVGPLRHEGQLSAAAFSRDGRQIRTVGSDGKVGLWDAATGTLVRLLDVDKGGIKLVEFSPSGRRLVAIGAGGTRLWDPISGAIVAAFPEADRNLDNPIFDRQGRRFVTSSRRESRIWDADTGAPLGPALRNVGRIDWTGASLSPDGSRVVTTSHGGSCATVWNATTGEQAAELCRGSPVFDAFFDATGQRVFLRGGSMVDLWDLTNPARPVAFFDHPDVATGAYPNKDRYLRTKTPAGAFVWDLSGRRRIGPLRHSAPISSYDLDDSERYLLTASEDGTARLWDLAGVELTSPVVSFPISPRGGVFSRDGKRYLQVFGAFGNATQGFQQLFDVTTGELLVPPMRHGGAIEYTGYLEIFSPDERRVVSGGADGKVRVWSAETGEPLLTLSIGAPVSDVGFSPDGKLIAAGESPSAPASRAAGSARLWDAATGLPLGQPMTGIAGPVAVAFSPDGRELATCGEGTAAIWDASSGRPVVPAWRVDGLSGAFGGVFRCHFSPDGRWLLTGGTSVRLWDALTGAPRASFPGYYGLISPTNDRLASVVETPAVLVSSLATGKALTPPLELEGLAGLAGNVDFSSHGRWVLGAAQSIRAWDVASGTLLAVQDSRSWTTGGALKGAVFLPAKDGALLGEPGSVEQHFGRHWTWRFARDDRPLSDLIELASLLAGYRVPPAANAPVPLTAEELRRAWDRRGKASAEASVVPTEKVVAWHRRLAEELAEEGRFAAALPHFDAVIQLGPARATVFENRGHVRAELGQLEEAEADFRKAAELRPGFPDLWSHAALLRSARGDAAGQRQICSDLLRESGTTQNPDRAYWIARTCTLVPGDAAFDTGRVVGLTELALPISGVPAEILDLKGAALHRAGRHEEARAILLAAVEARGQVTPWEAAFLAMVHHRIQRPVEGRRWLERAVGARTAKPAGVSNAEPAWTERLEAKALLAEARALLGVK